jgi:hypothetical protein
MSSQLPLAATFLVCIVVVSSCAEKPPEPALSATTYISGSGETLAA